MTHLGERDAVMINYVGRSPERPRYYANDHSRDTVVIEPQPMRLLDGRALGLSLDGAGFKLVDHKSMVADLGDRESAPDYAREIEAVLLAVSCGYRVIVTGAPILRFSERTGKAGSSDNSYPARFAHVDISDATGQEFSAKRGPEGQAYQRAAHYNVWRVLSPAPQDVPLALCDARTLGGDELIYADAIFDSPSGDWSFEGYVVAHDPSHQWMWFPDMTPDEAIIFKTHDSDKTVAPCVPHVAFDDPQCPGDAQARVSAEIRAIAYWYA